MTERLFTILAALLLIAALVFLWRNNMSAVFVTATLGAVAWFLGYRTRLRATIETDSRRNDGDVEE